MKTKIPNKALMLIIVIATLLLSGCITRTEYIYRTTKTPVTLGDEYYVTPDTPAPPTKEELTGKKERELIASYTDYIRELLIHIGIIDGTIVSVKEASNKIALELSKELPVETPVKKETSK